MREKEPSLSPADKEKQGAAVASVFAAVLLTVLKLGVGLATNSLGVLSEAAHSALDLLAAGMTFFAVKFASAPADRGHPYGHGKIENLSALVETLLLVITCIWITREALDRLLFNPVVVRPSVWAVLVMVISIVVDYSRSRMLMRVAKEHRSQALEADALHFSTDMLSSAVVLVGLGALHIAELLPESSSVRPWLQKADAVAALGVSLIVLKVSWSLGKRAVNVLLDAGDAPLTRNILASLQALSGVNEIKSIRLRHSGADMFVDIELAVDGKLLLEEAEYVRTEVEQRVFEHAEHAKVTIVLTPQVKEEGDRITRLRGLAAAHGLNIHAVDVLELEQDYEGGERVLVEMHVEFPPDTPLEAAYHKVSTFETEFRKTRPNVVMVSHIEPLGEMGREKLASISESREIMETVIRIVSEEPGVRDPHNVLVRGFGDGRCASFHCRMDAGTSVEDAHAVATKLQRAIRAEFPQLDRVTVQMEPFQAGGQDIRVE